MTAVGQSVGGYTLLSKLGDGGSSSVWRCQDTAGNLHAIKLFREDQRELVFREITGLRRIQTLGVPEIRDGFVRGENEEGFVMRLVEGRRWPQPGALWDEIQPDLERLLEILSHVHGFGYAHGDLKPGNILKDEGGALWLLDFGFATPERVPGEHAGTPRYMAPEVLRRETPRPPADLYSLALVVYEALYGELPETGSLPALMRSRLTGGPLEFPGVPEPYAAWLSRCTSADVALRPRNAGELLLRLAGAGMPWEQLPDRLSFEEMQDLFHGPDVVLHLRQDAAEVLKLRTQGVGPRVAQELQAWVDRGLARVDGDKLRIERSEIRAIWRSGLFVSMPDSASPNEHAVLDLAPYACPALTLDAIVALSGLSRELAVVALNSLAEKGAAVEHDDRWWLPATSQRRDAGLSRRAFDHLPSDALARVDLSFDFMPPEEAAAYAVDFCMARDREGATDDALEVLREKTRSLVRQPVAQAITLNAWASIAFFAVLRVHIEELTWWAKARPDLIDLNRLADAYQAHSANLPTALGPLESFHPQFRLAVTTLSTMLGVPNLEAFEAVDRFAKAVGDTELEATNYGRWAMYVPDIETANAYIELAIQGKSRAGGRLQSALQRIWINRDTWSPQERLVVVEALLEDAIALRSEWGQVVGHDLAFALALRTGQVRRVNYDYLEYRTRWTSTWLGTIYLVQALTALNNGVDPWHPLFLRACDAPATAKESDFRWVARAFLIWLKADGADASLEEIANGCAASPNLDVRAAGLGIVRLCGFDGPQLEVGHQAWKSLAIADQMCGNLDVMWTHEPCFGDHDPWTPRGVTPPHTIVSPSA